MSSVTDESAEMGPTTESLPGEQGDDHHLTQKAHQYGVEVITGDEWPLSDIDLTQVTWETSTRAKRRHGSCAYSEGDITIVISEHTFENAGFEACKETIRHELIHAWQHQHSGETATVDGQTVTVAAGHGESFSVWVDPLDIDGRCSNHYQKTEHDYKHRIYCSECGFVDGFHRAGKTVKGVRQNPDNWSCGKCDGSGDLSVESD